ncbi:MAG: hypothetical protein HFJ20_05045 [Clostridia bacterium]|nr:hypothetical protein [Clostridia bacterium]
MLKNNKMLKISLVVIMVVGIITISSISMASDSFIGDQNQLKPSVPEQASGIYNLGNNLLGIFQTVGYIAAVIVLVWLGIKYIMASPDGKAEIKKQAFAYILGAILLFSAATIVTIIKGFTTI